MFCSEKCRDEHKAKDIDHEPIHHLERLISLQNPGVVMIFRVFLKCRDLFGSTEELRKFVEAHENKSYNLFDFDWSIDSKSPEYLKNLLLLIVSTEVDGKDGMRKTFASYLCKFGKNRFAEIFLNDTPRNLSFIDKLLSQISKSNSIAYCPVTIKKEHLLAQQCHPAMNLLGISCDSNIFIFNESAKRTKRIVWMVNQPIRAGDELTGFARNVALYYHSQTAHCNRDMNCLPCKKGWSKQINHDQISIDSEHSMQDFFQRHDPFELSNQLMHIQECSDFINSNFDGYYSKDSRVRQKIATKKEQLRKSVNSIPSQLPPYGLPMLSKMSTSEKRKYMEHYEYACIMHYELKEHSK